MQVPFFINPIAGRGRAARAAPELLAILRRYGIDADLRESRSRGDLEQQILDAATNGAEAIIVAGGDGSMHEAANGIVASGRSVSLGLLPVGTGNDFAKACKIPLAGMLAADELGQRMRDGRPLMQADLGVCNERIFSNGTGIGIDAKVASLAARVRLPVGNLVYVYGVMRCLWEGISTPAMQVYIDDELIFGGPAVLANIANGPWVGGQFHIAPDASPEDGLLNVVVAASVSRLRVLQLLPRLIHGAHLSAPEITHCTGRSIRVVCAEPIVAHLDGELQAPVTEFEIKALPGALRLL